MSDFNETMIDNPSKARGFANLTPERRTEIARMGGITAHKNGTAHQFSTVEAIAAGKLSRVKAKSRATAGVEIVSTDEI